MVGKLEFAGRGGDLFVMLCEPILFVSLFSWEGWAIFSSLKVGGGEGGRVELSWDMWYYLTFATRCDFIMDRAQVSIVTVVLRGLMGSCRQSNLLYICPFMYCQGGGEGCYWTHGANITLKIHLTHSITSGDAKWWCCKWMYFSNCTNKKTVCPPSVCLLGVGHESRWR